MFQISDLISYFETTCNSAPYMVQARELLANITLLEVAVLKLEEQTSVLQNEVGHARIEREIFELRHSSAGSAPLSSERSNLYSASLDSNANFGDNHSDSLPSISSSSQEQQLKPVSTSTLEEMTGLQSCTSPRQKSQFQLPQKSWKVCFEMVSTFSCQSFNVEKHTLSVWNSY